MRILLAGAAGQVALSLVEAGRARGVDLVALGRPDLDLTRESDVVRVVADVKPDVVVINAAAFTAVDLAESEPEAAHLLNATAAGWLAREAARVDAPILHVSTDYVFDGAKPAPYLEDDVARPLGVYGASKLAGELAVAAANPRHVVARTAWVCSPFGKNFVRTMLHLASDREELAVSRTRSGIPTYAPHIAEAMLVIASQCTKPDVGILLGRVSSRCSRRGDLGRSGGGDICRKRREGRGVRACAADNGRRVSDAGAAAAEFETGRQTCSVSTASGFRPGGRA